MTVVLLELATGMKLKTAAMHRTDLICTVVDSSSYILRANGASAAEKYSKTSSAAALKILFY